MKHITKSTLLFLSLFLLIFTTNAQDAPNSVTIEQCQQWAVSQSSANKQKELNSQLLKVKLNNAGAHLFPKLEISGDVGYFSDNYLLPLTTENNTLYHIGLDFEQVLMDGFKLHYGRQYEKLLNEAEIYKVELSINEMKEQIIAIYLNLLILDKQMSILTNAQTTLDQQKDQMKTLEENGIIPASAISQLEVEILKVAQSKGELKATKESLIASLSILTGQDLSNAEFAMPDVPTTDINATSVRLEYSVFENAKRTMDYQRKLHLSSSMPKISLFATGGYGQPYYEGYNFFNPYSDWYYAVGIRFRVPLIDWAKTSGIGKAINLKKTILESQQSDFDKSNKIAIQEKTNEIKRIENLLVLDNQITAKQKEITKAFSIQLLNGTISTYDYIKQQNGETQSLIDKEVHNIQLLKAKYELLALKGRI